YILEDCERLNVFKEKALQRAKEFELSLILPLYENYYQEVVELTKVDSLKLYWSVLYTFISNFLWHDITFIVKIHPIDTNLSMVPHIGGQWASMVNDIPVITIWIIKNGMMPGSLSNFRILL